MIVAITKAGPPEAVEPVTAELARRGARYQVVRAGDGRHVISIEAPDSLLAALRSDPAIAEAHAFDAPWGLVGRSRREEGTRVPFGSVEIGATPFVVIAGPCSVEGRSQLETTALAVRRAGGHGLRGGAFKPRTSPHDFQGLGSEGLEHLLAVGRQVGLPVVTEVMAPEDVELVGSHADMLQVGSRNVQNFRLLEAVGYADRPVLLKRGMMSTIDEYLAAAEYVYMRGNTGVVLCERGIRSFEPRLRNTLDLGAVAMLKRLTHLPVLVDPSHGCGRRELVPDLARAAMAVGADGLLVEVHPEPESALSDGQQSLRPTDLEDLMRSLHRLGEALGRPLAAVPGEEAEANA